MVKRFGENEVLRGISLELQRHEVVCLIGASGSGKSTLLRCVNMFERIDGGDIKLFGQASPIPGSIKAGATSRRYRLSAYNLFPHMTVLENVVLGPVRAHKRSRDEVREEAMSLLERIGLKERAQTIPNASRAVSSSASPCPLARHASLAAALDEVTSALDPTLVAKYSTSYDLAHQG